VARGFYDLNFILRQDVLFYYGPSYGLGVAIF
jgi:hypothetical protein